MTLIDFDVLILTEAFRDAGGGHISRCTSVYEAIRSSGASVRMLVHSDLRNWNLASSAAERIDWQDHDSFISILEEIRPKSVLIDSYRVSEWFYYQAKETARTLVVLDDFHRIEYPPGSIVVNPAFSARKSDYSPEQEPLCGSDYTLLRKPFSDEISPFTVRPDVETILLTLGMTADVQLLAALSRSISSAFPKASIRVIAGDTPNAEKILNSGKCEIYSRLSAHEMLDMMMVCDIAITSGGQTALELLRVGVPEILVETASNQRENIQGILEKQGGLFGGTAIKHSTPDMGPALAALRSFDNRQHISRCARQVLDGKGGERIARRMLN